MKSRRIIFCFPLTVAGLLLEAPRAGAVELLPDGKWVTLASPEVSHPSLASPYTFEGGPWTMSSLTPVRLSVTDWLDAGDLFQVYNFDQLLGTGSDIVVSGAFELNPELAFANPFFSKNSWILEPGDYSLTFKAIRFAPTFDNGTIAFKAESLTVPDAEATFW